MQGLMLALLSAYKRGISPFLPAACRFHPTCSEYSFQSLKKHGLFKGAFFSVLRIARCHPWNPGGYDPVR
jgi:putative membrane protein insertion efficiency factor